MNKSRAAVPGHAETQRIGDMIDFATGAKQIADNLGEKFLAYLLGMAIQEMDQIQSRHAVLNAAESQRDLPSASETSS